MRFDDTKIDEAALAVLSLAAFEERGITRAWKSIDWDVMNRLNERGLIGDPRNKAKSVIFTDEGIVAARAAVEKLFSPNTRP